MVAIRLNNKKELSEFYSIFPYLGHKIWGSKLIAYSHDMKLWHICGGFHLLTKACIRYDSLSEFKELYPEYWV